MIPDEAVEAAAKALAGIGGQPHNWANYRNPARAALEAAALCLKPRASLKVASGSQTGLRAEGSATWNL